MLVVTVIRKVVDQGDSWNGSWWVEGKVAIPKDDIWEMSEEEGGTTLIWCRGRKKYYVSESIDELV